MASPTFKLTLHNASFTTYSTDASGMLTYYADYGAIAHNPNDINTLIQAIASVPCGPIGTPINASIAGGPSGLNNNQLSYHVPRVYSITPRIVNDLNCNKLFVDVVFRSRPKPTYEQGSGTSQVSTSTYLSSADQNSQQRIGFSQMTLDWFATAGIGGSIPGSVPATLNPPVDTPWPKAPFVGQKFQFGATFRLGATFYSDELTLAQISILQSNYTNTINLRSTGLFDGTSPYNDRRQWLTTAVNVVSNDAGFTNQVSVEMIFSPFGWDSLGIFTVPFTQSKAILTADVIANLNLMLGADNTALSVPPPYIPSGGGAGRWPQQPAVNVNALLGFLCQGTGGFTTYTRDQALNPLTTF